MGEIPGDLAKSLDFRVNCGRFAPIKIGGVYEIRICSAAEAVLSTSLAILERGLNSGVSYDYPNR